MRILGIMITKDEEVIFGDWCRSQLPLYDAVVCVDVSLGHRTREIAERLVNRLVYLHESDLSIRNKTDHSLRRIAHNEIMQRFGEGDWIMCCHADEFCYHDPRKIAAKAEAEGYDAVSWFSLHSYLSRPKF